MSLATASNYDTGIGGLNQAHGNWAEAYADSSRAGQQALFDYLKPSKIKERDEEVEQGGAGLEATLKGVQGAGEIYDKGSQAIQGAKELASNISQGAQRLQEGAGQVIEQGRQVAGRLGGRLAGFEPQAVQGDIESAVPKAPMDAPAQLPDRAPMGDLSGLDLPTAGIKPIDAPGQSSNVIGDIINQGRGSVARNVENIARPMAGDIQGVGGDISGSMKNVGNILNQGNQTINSNLGNLGQNIRQNLNTGLNDVKGALADTNQNIHGAIQQLSSRMDDLGQTTSDIAKGTSGLLEGGLEGAAGVMDMLGPVGDLVGLGMAIFGGVEAHKQAKVEKESEDQSQAVMNQPVQAPVVSGQNVSASLDTSHPAQAVASSHY